MIESRLGLEGRTVVVAGAGGGGIGTAVCGLLAAAGVAVAAIDLDHERLAPARDVVADAGGRGAFLVADVREPDGVERAVAEAVAMLGVLHGLVHVVGGLQNQWAPTLDVALESFDDVVRLNLHSALLTSQAVARCLVQQGTPGSIVHIASIVGLSSMPYGASYSAAKAGLIALMRTEAVEWGEHGIRVNAIVCGTIRTPASDAHGTVADTDEERAAIPLGRRGTPDDIAGAALFLLSDLASFVSGQVLGVDGASSVRASYLGADNLPVFVHDDALRTRLRGDGGS